MPRAESGPGDAIAEEDRWRPSTCTDVRARRRRMETPAKSPTKTTRASSLSTVDELCGQLHTKSAPRRMRRRPDGLRWQSCLYAIDRDSTPDLRHLSSSAMASPGPLSARGTLPASLQYPASVCSLCFYPSLCGLGTPSAIPYTPARENSSILREPLSGCWVCEERWLVGDEPER